VKKNSYEVSACNPEDLDQQAAVFAELNVVFQSLQNASRLNPDQLQSQLHVLEKLLKVVQSQKASVLPGCLPQPAEGSAALSPSCAEDQIFDLDYPQRHFSPLESKYYEHQPYSKFRKFKRICKVLLLAYVLYWFSLGQPDLMFKGIYQGLKYGFTTKCSDWYSCPEFKR